MDDIFHVTRIA